MLTAGDLRVNDAAAPLGIDEAPVRFSWVPELDVRGARQSAYHIVVAHEAAALTGDKGTVWDSGRVASGQTCGIRPAFALVSARRYFWKVRLWDGAGAAGPWSTVAEFGTGICTPEDWSASWIGTARPDEPVVENMMQSPAEIEKAHGAIAVDGRSLLLRGEAVIGKKVVRATAFVCGLGMNVFSINGCRVGSSVFTPAKTDYRRQVLYEAHDVTAHLREGKNAFGIMLGNGWYNPKKKWWGWQMQWHGAKRALVQIHIEYADGGSEVIGTDERWTMHPGPVIDSCIYDGETYDARDEVLLWNTPDFSSTGWEPVRRVAAPGGVMRFHAIEPIAITERRRPVAMWESAPGVFIVDFGQNFSGFCELSVCGPRGATVTIRHAEDITAAGELDPGTNGDAENADRYILRGGGPEMWRPEFTYHGFRYAEVVGYPGQFTPDSLIGCVIHTACAQAGEFHCANETINHIHRCTVWSQRSNMMGLPTDDNQRAERLGWMADGHVVAKEFSCNFESARFYRKWLRDHAFSQDPVTGDVAHISPRPHSKVNGTPAWSSAYPIMAWHLYEVTGDSGILDEHYSGIRAYVDYLGTTAVDGILPPDRYGDWCSSADGMRNGDPLMLSSWYYYWDVTLLVRMARVLRRADDAARYDALAQTLRAQFNTRFLDAARKRYGTGSQTEMALPLYLHMEPDAERSALFEQLVRDIAVRCGGALRAGIAGARHIIELLTDEGRRDLAWRVATRTEYPSWGSMTRGMTTLSETWSALASAGTHNHVMFGAIDAWFYQELAGVKAGFDDAGAFRIVIDPYIPDDLAWARAAVPTPVGRVAAGWSRRGARVLLDVSVPANQTATVRLPAMQVAGARVFEGREIACDAGQCGSVPGVTGCAITGSVLSLTIGGGQYRFSFDWIPASACTPETERVSFWHSPFVTEWRQSALLPATDIRTAAHVRPPQADAWAAVRGTPFVNVHERARGDGCVYCTTHVAVEADSLWTLHVGHDGGIRLFVDGSPVACTAERINPAPKTRTAATVRLARGEHEITVAIDTDEDRGWGFFFSFEIPESERTVGGMPAFPRVLDV